MSEHKVKLNLHHSPPDRRDYKIRIKARQPLKFQNVDLSSYCTTVKDQGYIGSCTAFAVIALMEYIHKRAINNGTEDIYSEKFTYYDTRVNQLGWPANEDSGAYLRNAMASVIGAGAAPEEKFPYDASYSQIPPREVFDSAMKNQVVSYAKVAEGSSATERQQSLQDCLQLLQEGYPLVGGFVCYDSLWTAQNGVVPPPGGTIIGGHAILIVGYDEGKRLFKFKNSWGSSWGDNGYGYLPYEYLLAGDLWDLWTVFSQENFSDSEVIDIDKPTAEDEKKHNKEEVLKLWGDVVKSSQDLSRYSQQNADLSNLLKKCVEAVNTVRRELTTVQSQVEAHKQEMSKKSDDLHKKIVNVHDLLTGLLTEK